MKCPHCNADTRVLQTTNEVRRRECFNMHRFNTLEVMHDPRADRREAARVRRDALTKFQEERQVKIAEIRAATGTLQSIADRFGKSISYVWKIRKGQS